MEFSFILGNPRSGTSMFRLILNAHPNLVAPPECGFIQWLHGEFLGLDLRRPEAQQKFATAMLGSKKAETWHLEKQELVDTFAGLDDPDYEDCCKAVFTCYGARQEKRDIVHAIDKNNYYVRELDTLELAMPSAKYLHMVRDGRDVAASYLALMRNPSRSPYAPNLPTHIEDIAQEWSENNLRIEAFLENKTHFSLRYEDLLLHPEDTLLAVSEFLGTSFDPEMLDFYKKNDEPASTMDWKQQTRNPVSPSRIGQHATYLNSEEIQCFEAEAGDVLQKYRYL